MAILIDMELPDNCTRCDYIGLNTVVGCPIMSGTRGRAVDCPLFEVPEPHGRLISEDDLDAAVKIIKNALLELKTARTVIPASVEG